MSSKTLARTGASIFNRFSNPILQQKPKLFTHNVVPQSRDISPKLCQSFLKLGQPSLHLQQNNNNGGEVEGIVKRSDFDWFLHRCGVPSIPFFLPEPQAAGRLKKGSCECERREETKAEKPPEGATAGGSSRAATNQVRILQMSRCSYFPNERTNLATSSVRGLMDSLLGKPPREDGESLHGGLPRVELESLGN